MPVVCLWRNGFYFNFSHIKFLNRYKILSPYTWPHFNSNSVVESIAQIIRSVPLPAAEFGIGLTKASIREDVLPQACSVTNKTVIDCPHSTGFHSKSAYPLRT